AGLTGPPRVNLQCGPNPVRAGAFRRVPEIQGLYPKSKPPLLGVVLISVSIQMFFNPSPQ
ncbi:MAG: hypothetical protein UDV71_08465, partial [Collinsella sp.]|nr:hypothetical protein [Collinsella sp.]